MNGGGDAEDEGSRPCSLLTLPATSRCGEGEPPPLFQREAHRGQVTCPKSRSLSGAITQEYWTAQGQGSHCGTALLWWMEGQSAGKFTDSLSLDLDDKLPTHKPRPPELLSITALGYLISWSVQHSSATWRLACSIFPSSNKGPCYQTRAEGSASRRTWPGGRGHTPFLSPSKSPRNPLGCSWYLP